VTRLLLALALVLAAAVPAVAAEVVTLRAADGTTLSAMWHAPSRPAPAIVLVHMLTRSHREWDGAAQALNASGFAVLALDLRGHGDSGGSYAAGLGSMQQDVHAALAWVKQRPEVLPAHLGVAGASLGAALAVIAAAADPAVRSMALLSPGGEYRGLRCEASMRKFAERGGAAMLVAATGDPYAARTARHFAAMGSGLRDLRVVDGSSAHGTHLFETSPDLLPAFVDWFRRSLL
jgi:alpha-beta hydrolase superfamily lysophospholipase